METVRNKTERKAKIKMGGWREKRSGKYGVKNWKQKVQERKQWKEIIEQAKTHKEL